jgi:hypothetical protein
MSTAKNYHRRALECVAYAKNARDDEERRQLLTMASILNRLAHMEKNHSEAGLASEDTRGARKTV